ncbi:MAG: hypothetical protein M3R06_03175 [Chloroflexota bacterium]|nr:hypothetical protein [Chloroflexota bacterium]
MREAGGQLRRDASYRRHPTLVVTTRCDAMPPSHKESPSGQDNRERTGGGVTVEVGGDVSRVG